MNDLHFAAMRGDVERVKELIESSKIPINFTGIKNSTALHFACVYNREKVVEILLSFEDLQVDLFNDMGCTPLLYATRNGYVKVVKLLLEDERVDVNLMQKLDGRTVLHDSVARCYLGVVKLLLNVEGINVNLQIGNRKETALHWASYKGYEKKREKNRLEIVKLLLNAKGIRVDLENRGGKTALDIALVRGFTEIAKLLLEVEGIPTLHNRSHALVKASYLGYKRIIHGVAAVKGIEYSYHQVKYSKFHETLAGYRFMKWRSMEMIKYILGMRRCYIAYDLKIGFRVENGVGKTNLLFASEGDCSKVTYWMVLPKEFDINSQNLRGETALHVASRQGCLEVFKLLKINGIDLNIQDKKGATALHVATSYKDPWFSSCVIDRARSVYKWNDIQKAKFLLEAGSDEGSEKNPMVCAENFLYEICLGIERKRLEVLNLLLNFEEVDVNLQNEHGETALHLACYYYDVWCSDRVQSDYQDELQRNRHERVRLLLYARKINVNLQDKNGSTVLHIASERAHPELVKQLLEVEELDVNLKNSRGQTALHLAARHRDSCFPRGVQDRPLAEIERNRLEVVKLLLEVEHLQVNMRDDCGFTPLHLAVLDCQFGVVSLLASDARVEVNSRDSMGQTPLEIAVENRREGLIHLLRSR